MLRRDTAALTRDGTDSHVTEDTKKPGAVVIKKYANRRLYNTSTSSYVTLEHLAELTRQNIDFVVYDAKSGEDITRTVLTQIIFDEENNGSGKSLLPVQFLRQLIGFYGDSMQSFVPAYLELSMKTFADQQARMRNQLTDALTGKDPASFFEEAMRQNMAFLEQTTKMFAPFTAGWAQAASKLAEEKVAPAPAPAAKEPTLAEMQAQLAAMQKKIEDLANK
jgi:polyhydroxyalkanoate synthesis repressor PhaR